jgi:C4-dicarboxylate transporter DctM subunit
MERLLALISVAPGAVLIMAVLGSIYKGIATVTDAASLGLLAAVSFAWANRTLGWGTLLECLLAEVKTTSMIILIVMGASFLSRAMEILGIPRE